MTIFTCQHYWLTGLYRPTPMIPANTPDHPYKTKSAEPPQHFIEQKQKQWLPLLPLPRPPPDLTTVQPRQ